MTAADIEATGTFAAVGESSTGSAYFLVIDGPKVGELYKIDDHQADLVIGRSETSAVRINEAAVSRHHARVWIDAGHLFIQDAGSVNGTFRNGVRLEGPSVLEDGDILTFGGTSVIKFTASDDEHEVFRERLLRLGERDSVTRTLRPEYFFDRLRAEFGFTSRHQTPLACLIVDIDTFSAFNAVFGFAAGNNVLRRMAEFLQALIRREDLLVRLRDDRFAILCRGTHGGAALVLAERLRSGVANVDFTGIDQVPLTVSVGVASAPHRRCRSDSDLVDCATIALAIAKGQGRNCIAFAD